jgi:alpha-galactosidase
VPEGFMTPWDTFAVDWLHERLNEQKRAAPFFYGDFYPLLTYNLADDQWAAWQFDRPDLGKGIVQAFRRPESPFDHMDARLQGLDPAAFYEVEDEDSGWGSIISGEDLMAAGFTITIDERPGSSLVFYRRFRDQKEPKSTPEIHHQ